MLTTTRFLRFIILATLLLLVPAFVYLSQGTSNPVRDSRTGEYIWEAMIQSMQGHGPDQDQVSHGRPYFPITDWRGFASNWMPNYSSIYNNWNRPMQTGVHPTATTPTLKLTPAPHAPTAVTTSSLDTSSMTKVEDIADGAYARVMSNETAKADLGRSTWKFLHTMMARFPENPTPQQSEDLRKFIHLFSLLYPCGDCASHFQQLLKEWPPQVGSRHNAEMWLCNAHNVVNKRLKKPHFDCTKLNETYDCGCGSKGGHALKTPLAGINPMDATGMAHIMPVPPM